MLSVWDDTGHQWLICQHMETQEHLPDAEPDENRPYSTQTSCIWQSCCQSIISSEDNVPLAINA